MWLVEEFSDVPAGYISEDICHPKHIRQAYRELTAETTEPTKPLALPEPVKAADSVKPTKTPEPTKPEDDTPPWDIDILSSSLRQ
jgi:hypothetical protein